MIKLEKGMVLAHVASLANLFKGYVDGRVSALATSVSEVMEDVDSSITDLENGKADADFISDETIEKFQAANIDLTSE